MRNLGTMARLTPAILGFLFVFTEVAAPATALQTEGGAPDFDEWVAGVRTEALARGIRAETLDAAFKDVEPIPRVIELDRSQPEFTLTFEQYVQRVAPRSRIEEGRRRLAENQDILSEIGARFGVQPRFIVALWGIETGFGKHTGAFSVIASLATLAHDGRRSAYFRKELMNALTILDQGHIAPDAMQGSWAGAMGQSQFMPSSFLNFAIDYDGDGRRDIWSTKADVFASAANYLSKSGWRDDQTWGRRVSLPEAFDAALAGHRIVKPLDDWQALGVRRGNGDDLPTRPLPASLVLPDGTAGPAFLVYDNFRATLKWNRSDFFALTVGHLADRIGRR